jgi:hypothetical protein
MLLEVLANHLAVGREQDVVVVEGTRRSRSGSSRNEIRTDPCRLTTHLTADIAVEGGVERPPERILSPHDEVERSFFEIFGERDVTVVDELLLIVAMHPGTG